MSKVIKRLGVLGFLINSFFVAKDDSLSFSQKTGVISVNLLAFSTASLITSALLSGVLIVNILVILAVLVVISILAYWLTQFLFFRED